MDVVLWTTVDEYVHVALHRQCVILDHVKTLTAIQIQEHASATIRERPTDSTCRMTSEFEQAKYRQCRKRQCGRCKQLRHNFISRTCELFGIQVHACALSAICCSYSSYLF